MLHPIMMSVWNDPGPAWKSGPSIKLLKRENQENLQTYSHRSDVRSS